MKNYMRLTAALGALALAVSASASTEQTGVIAGNQIQQVVEVRSTDYGLLEPRVERETRLLLEQGIEQEILAEQERLDKAEMARQFKEEADRATREFHFTPLL